MSIPVIIISDNNSTVELLKLYIEENSNYSFLAGTSDYTKAFEALKELDKSLAIIDISGYQEQALNFVSKVHLEFPNSKIVTLSDKPDVDTVIRAMRVGTADFIPVPVIKEEFLASLEGIYNEIAGIKQKKSKCRVLSVYSNKGGVGKTSIATNLALELAKVTKEKVALIDLNFHMGDVATFLDLKPSFNISYMLQNSDKLNEDFLLSTMERYRDSSLYVLADSPIMEKSFNASVNDIKKLFEILRNTFSYVIVDTSAGFDKKALNILECSDIVLLLTIVNLPALRNCQRCIEFFEKTGFDKEKIQVVVNRYMENDEINIEAVEDLLGKPVYWKIPNNYFTMMSAINKGVPVSEVNPDSNVALSYKNLALTVSDSVYYKRMQNVR